VADLVLIPSAQHLCRIRQLGCCAPAVKQQHQHRQQVMKTCWCPAAAPRLPG